MAAAGDCAEEAAVDGALPCEVEVLESIYLDELQVSRGRSRSEPWEICITLHPATAEDQDSQYVCFTLGLAVPPQYPNEAPKISIRNPRGLSDEQIHKISQTLGQVAEARLGTAVLYELIEKGKEILTDNNIPHGQCVICLYGFQEREAFTKTRCYHYFHSHCLARYAQHMEQELRAQQGQQEPHLAPLPEQGPGVQCPVCRETLIYDLSALQAAPPPQHPLEQYRPDAEALRQQAELHLIYKRQQRKGGIIDPEAERNRYFISLQAPPAASEPGPVPPLELATPGAPELPCQLTGGAPDPPDPSGAPVLKGEARPPDNMSVPVEQQNRRERRPGPRGQPRPAGSDSDTYYRARGFGRRPERWEDRSQRATGRCSQEHPRPHARAQASVCANKEEPCQDSATGATVVKEESSSEGAWVPEQAASTRSQEKENLALNHSKPRPSPSWQGPSPARDCGRWGKARERGTHPRGPRGRGAFRPGSRREPQVLETESGS
ncbi:PREDICTED: E3 ubiquitin-protein ligase RNF25 [Gavialis gangeticus]|uniref:E3 ubiquitin-protein ligase RNF25 n=1 Tax=Gavialis gangeticus TaxID=94835 RepID=UPI00092E6E02|nr:PREDICTED: E3 ubiquitin-protein ligase RNF25 [Gavialis gangeticus]